MLAKSKASYSSRMKFKKFFGRILRIILIQVVCVLALLFLRSRSTNSLYLFEEIFAVSLVTPVLIFLVFQISRYKLTSGFQIRAIREVSLSISLTVVSALIFLTFAQNSLVNIDRSRSFYVLSWINQELIVIGTPANSGIDLTLVESPEKMNKPAISQRITEQIQRGNVEITSQTARLTWQGKLILQLANFLANKFHLFGWYQNNH